MYWYWHVYCIHVCKRACMLTKSKTCYREHSDMLARESHCTSKEDSALWRYFDITNGYTDRHECPVHTQYILTIHLSRKIVRGSSEFIFCCPCACKTLTQPVRAYSDWLHSTRTHCDDLSVADKQLETSMDTLNVYALYTDLALEPKDWSIGMPDAVGLCGDWRLRETILAEWQTSGRTHQIWVTNPGEKAEKAACDLNPNWKLPAERGNYAGRCGPRLLVEGSPLQVWKCLNAESFKLKLVHTVISYSQMAATFKDMEVADKKAMAARL